MNKKENNNNNETKVSSREQRERVGNVPNIYRYLILSACCCYIFITVRVACCFSLSFLSFGWFGSISLSQTIRYFGPFDMPFQNANTHIFSLSCVLYILHLPEYCQTCGNSWSVGNKCKCKCNYNYNFKRFFCVALCKTILNWLQSEINIITIWTRNRRRTKQNK